MALSQEFGPDLCENRSAPGTPPHGGAGDATRRGGGSRDSDPPPGLPLGPRPVQPAPAPHGLVTCRQRTPQSCSVQPGTARRSAVSRVGLSPPAASASLSVPSGRALRGSVRSAPGATPPQLPARTHSLSALT